MPDPELTARNVDGAERLDAVHRIGIPDRRAGSAGLGDELHAVDLKNLATRRVVRLDQPVAHELLPIVEKPLLGFGIGQFPTGEERQEADHRITRLPLKPIGHGSRPGSEAVEFHAVKFHRLEAGPCERLASQFLENRAGDVAEMKLGGTRIEEINHGAAGIRTWHDQLLPVIQTDEAQDGPVPRRHLPTQLAVGFHLRCQVHDLVPAGDGLGWIVRHRQHRHFAKVAWPTLLITRTIRRQFGQWECVVKTGRSLHRGG